MTKKLLIPLLIGSLYACAPMVRDDRYEKSIMELGISCEKPYRLTRNCDDGLLATGISEIQGKVFNHAGNEAGDVVWIRTLIDPLNMVRTSWESTWVFYGIKDPADLEIESILRIVESVLADNQIKIQKIIPLHLVSSRVSYGYFLELDKPGYHILEHHQYSAPE